MRNSALLIIIFLGFLLSVAPALSRAADTELHDRDVDEAALSSESAAQTELSSLLEKYRGTSQEPVFLARLAEIQQQAAAMEFRVANGKARRFHRPADLTSYKKMMGKSVPALSELISKFPHYQDIAHIYFMRGKAYEEMGSKAAAARDYGVLTRAYPDAPEAIQANMSLAEFATDANRFAEAIGYLKAVERHPEDEHYPVALYQMAWSYYNLKDTAGALATSGLLVDYYHGLAKAGHLHSAEQAMLENLLHDVPLFYFGGFEAKNPEYTTPKALDYFRKLDHDGPYLGKMMVQYAYLLRTHGYEQDLALWKDTVLAEEPKRPESLDVLMTTYEYQLHKRRYPELVKTSQDIVAYYRKNGHNEYSSKAESMLLETATSLQKLMLENKDHGSHVILAQWLAPILSAFTQIVDDNDPRLRGIHANLGETFFAIKDYEDAAKHYRWIVDHGHWSDQKIGGISDAEASEKSISSRYEYLRTLKLIPGDLKAVPLPQKDPANINPLVSEWIGWVDSHARHSSLAIDNFRFEANRCLYFQGHVNEATDRMRSFAMKNPRSPFALPSATLVVDTYIATQDWDRLESLANDFLGVGEWKSTPFYQRLYTVAADAKYKRVERLTKEKDYKDALVQANEFAEHYPRSEHFTDTLTLAGNSAVALHNRKLAIQYYARLALLTRNTPTSANARLAMGRIEEERYNFAAAANDYLIYLAMPSRITQLDTEKAHTLKKRVLVLSWLSGDQIQMGHLLRNRSICDRSLGAECNRFHALSLLMGSNRISTRLSMQAVALAQRSSPDVRPIYAAIALENAARLSMDTRHRMVHELSDNWKWMDEMAKFSLISRISVSVPRAFALDRSAIERSGRIRADARSLTKRLNLAREMESSAADGAQLPWTRVRVLVLNDVAWVYNDLADGIRRLPPPRRLNARERLAYQRMVDQMVSPFERKAQQIRGEAFRLASETGVEPEVYDRIANDFFRASARGGAETAIAIPRQRVVGQTLDLSLVRSVDSDGNWRPVDLDTADPAQILRFRWADAIERGQWAQVAFYAAEARDKNLIRPEVTGVAKAVSIASAGAKAEGEMALADFCRIHDARRIRDACSAVSQLGSGSQRGRRYY